MFKQFVKLSFLAVLVSLVGMTVTGRAGNMVQEPVVGSVNLDELETTRRATVQLVLFSSSGQLETVGSKVVKTSFGQTGLGTLVTFGKNTYLFTHDHWGDLEGVVRAQVLTFDGQLVADVPGDTFRHWILYRDGGTMVLVVPFNLAQAGGLQAAALGFGSVVKPGDVVLVTRQDLEHPGRVVVMQSEIVSLQNEVGSGTLNLRSLTGEPVVRGDSGGGVWLNGQLVGNNWRTDVLVVRGLALLNDGQPVELQQDTSLAAKVPAKLVEVLERLEAVSRGAEEGSLQNCLEDSVC